MEVINNIDIVMHTTNKKMEIKRPTTHVINKKTQVTTQEIKLLSTNPDFYKTFTFNNVKISVYLNIKEEEEYYLILKINKNKYYIKMGCLDEIKNLEYFKQMVLEDVCFYKTFVIDYPYLKNFKTDVYIDVPEDNIESLINPYTNKNKDKIFNNVHYTFNNNTNYYIKSCIIKDNVIMDVFPLIKEIELSLIK